MEGAAGSVFIGRQKPSNLPTEIVFDGSRRRPSPDYLSVRARLQNFPRVSMIIPQNSNLGEERLRKLGNTTKEQAILSHRPVINNDASQDDQEWRSRSFTDHPMDDISKPNTCTIFEAPNYMINDRNRATFRPTIVTIGLLHIHRSQQLLPQLHECKAHCLSHLLDRHESKEKAEELLEKCKDLVLRLEPHARSCYSVDRKDVGRHRFAEMLLQDSCFILHLLLKLTTSGERQEDKNCMLEGRITADLVMYDLLKLENQIPFFVLQSLFNLLKTPADKDIDLVELALEFLSNVHPTRASTFATPSSSEVLHLLHLFHSSLIPPRLLESTETARASDWMPTATLLRDAGIKFQARSKESTESFLEVRFKRGVMEIPPLQVDDKTSLVFHNLIAFERCYPYATNHITSYARFMDKLIDAGRDVGLLCLDGVLLNILEMEDAEVAAVFRQSAYDIPNTNYLSKVFTDVTKYYWSPWKKLGASFFPSYFNNP